MEVGCIFCYFDYLDSVFKRDLCLFINVAYIYSLLFYCFLSYFYVYGVILADVYVTYSAKFIASRYFCKDACVEGVCIFCYFDFFNSVFKRDLCLFINIAYIYSLLCCFCCLSYFYVYGVTFKSNVTCNAKFIASRYFCKDACVERGCIFCYFDFFNSVFKRDLCLFINIAYIYSLLCCFCCLSYFYVYGVTFKSNVTCNAKFIASRYFCKDACVERGCICCYFDFFDSVFERLFCLFINVAYIYFLGCNFLYSNIKILISIIKLICYTFFFKGITIWKIFFKFRLSKKLFICGHCYRLHCSSNRLVYICTVEVEINGLFVINTSQFFLRSLSSHQSYLSLYLNFFEIIFQFFFISFCLSSFFNHFFGFCLSSFLNYLFSFCLGSFLNYLFGFCLSSFLNYFFSFCDFLFRSLCFFCISCMLINNRRNFFCSHSNRCIAA